MINADFVAGATATTIALDDLANLTGLVLKGAGLTTVNVTGNTTATGGLGLVNGVITTAAKTGAEAQVTTANTLTILNIATDEQARVAFYGNDKLTKVDGSTSTGDIELHLDGFLAASGVSIATGSDDDVVWADMGKIKADTVINMGDGNDMFGMREKTGNSVTADIYTAIGKMTGVETVGFFLADQTFTIDASKLGGIKTST